MSTPTTPPPPYTLANRGIPPSHPFLPSPSATIATTTVHDMGATSILCSHAGRERLVDWDAVMPPSTEAVEAEEGEGPVTPPRRFLGFFRKSASASSSQSASSPASSGSTPPPAYSAYSHDPASPASAASTAGPLTPPPAPAHTRTPTHMPALYLPSPTDATWATEYTPLLAQTQTQTLSRAERTQRRRGKIFATPVFTEEDDAEMLAQLRAFGIL